MMSEENDSTVSLHGLHDSPEIDLAVSSTGSYAGISREPKPKKPGFWSKLGQSIGEAIGQAKFGQ